MCNTWFCSTGNYGYDNSMRVLILEDQVDLRKALTQRLRGHGYGVDEARDLQTADLHLKTHVYGVLILDRMVPDGDAVERLLGWRRGGLTTPVILLTARDRVEDRIEGLGAGADDYLVKPFSMDELLARVAAVARRQGSGAPSLVRMGGLEIDLARRQAERDGVLLPLRPKEYAVLEYLATHQGQAVSKLDLREACWDDSHESTSNVEEVVIAALRRKLGKPAVIQTVRGFGYVLELGT
jgi:DNA-binding response OmpR family regulator